MLRLHIRSVAEALLMSAHNICFHGEVKKANKQKKKKKKTHTHTQTLLSGAILYLIYALFLNPILKSPVSQDAKKQINK